MRIIILQDNISSEGGYKAGYLLNKLLNDNNITSHIVTLDKYFNFFQNFLFLLYRLINYVLAKLFFDKNITSTFPQIFNFNKIINKFDVDIIIISYANRTINFNKLKDIKKKRIILFIHDQWLVNGFRHFNLKFKKQNNFKTSIINFFEKRFMRHNIKSLCDNKNIQILASTKWLSEELKKNSIIKKKVDYLHNFVDHKFWKKNENINYKKKLNFKNECFNILFVAKYGIENIRKGGDLILKINEIIKKYNNINFILLGQYKNLDYQNIYNFSTRNEVKVRDIFCACDINLTLSRSDNMPYSILETMSCGLPNISMNVGGISEIIDHKRNGWILNDNSIDGILKAINWIKYKKNYKKLSNSSRIKIIDKYSFDTAYRKLSDKNLIR